MPKKKLKSKKPLPKRFKSKKPLPKMHPMTGLTIIRSNRGGPGSGQIVRAKKPTK